MLNYPRVSKLSEHTCRICNKIGTLKGVTEGTQEVVEKFQNVKWTFNVRVYDDEPPYNLECVLCGTGVYGKIGDWSAY